MSCGNTEEKVTDAQGNKRSFSEDMHLSWVSKIWEVVSEGHKGREKSIF